MSKTVLYYHAYLTDDDAAWSTIFLEQMKCMEDSGLFNRLDEIKVTAIAAKDRRRDKFFHLCDSYPVDCEIEFIDNPYANDMAMVNNIDGSDTASENITYQKIWDDCQKEDQTVAYFHTKGMTSYLRLLSAGTKQSVEAFKRYYYWRQFLNWGAIENWKVLVDALNTHDAAGVNYQQEPSPHFSGAFWWSKSEYIKTLPNPSTIDWWVNLKATSKDPWFSKAPNRYKDEHWLIHRKETKVFNLTNNKDNPYFTLLTKDKYQ